jgi:hypothetical protein
LGFEIKKRGDKIVKRRKLKKVALRLLDEIIGYRAVGVRPYRRIKYKVWRRV